MRDLELRVKTIEMEWINVYAQLKKAVGRMTKEAQLADMPDGEVAAPQNGLNPRNDLVRRHRVQARTP